MTHQNLTKLANNNTNSIKFDSLEKICMALKCSPNELFGLGARQIKKYKS
ncbi:helix-turn-helix domain-containing protein [Clostridioides difficile]|nr:helix-turn-helix domain-containing protein [Clostridioides difficile]TOY57873.1 hypothetical protein DA424_20345 [Clostridioides difficile]